MPGTVNPGQSWPWPASIAVNGTPVDASSLSLTVRDPLGNVVTPPFPIVLGGLTHDALGQYHYDWAVDPAAALGTYAAAWAGVTTTGRNVFGSDTVEVIPPNQIFTGAYCTATDVFTRLAGDNPTISGAYAGVVAAKCDEVSRDINRMVALARGCKGAWSFVADPTASVRLYAGRPGPIRLLPIDDAFSVSSVAIYTRGQLVRTLVAGTDFVPWPYNGGPIVGLMSLGERWPEEPGSIAVSARWGFGLGIPVDVREAAVIEVIRSYLSDQGGNDDRLGLTPWGSVVTSKDFVSKTKRLVSDYGWAGGFLR